MQTLLPEDEPIRPGWYWVKTKMFHRKPFKRWVIAELVGPEDTIQDAEVEEFDEPYCWLSPDCEELESEIIEVGPRIPDLEEHQ